MSTSRGMFGPTVMVVVVVMLGGFCSVLCVEDRAEGVRGGRAAVERRNRRNERLVCSLSRAPLLLLPRPPEYMDAHRGRGGVVLGGVFGGYCCRVNNSRLLFTALIQYVR